MPEREVAVVQSVDRALQLLELLAKGGGKLALSELAARSGLPLGTTHRLMQTLAVRGYVRRDVDRRYALGTALLPLGDAATRLLGSWAQPFLSQLAERSGETANLAVLEDDHVVYVAQAQGSHRMRMFTEVGRRVLPHSTAVGKVLLAWQPEEHVRRVGARLGFPRRTDRTLVTADGFAAALAEVRRVGWAVDDEEEEVGVRCVAVPVGPGPGAVAAMSVSAPASRLERDPAALLALMHQVADELAATLLAGAGR